MGVRRHRQLRRTGARTPNVDRWRAKGAPDRRLRHGAVARPTAPPLAPLQAARRLEGALGAKAGIGNADCPRRQLLPHARRTGMRRGSSANGNRGNPVWAERERVRELFGFLGAPRLLHQGPGGAGCLPNTTRSRPRVPDGWKSPECRAHHPPLSGSFSWRAPTTQSLDVHRRSAPNESERTPRGRLSDGRRFVPATRQTIADARAGRRGVGEILARSTEGLAEHAGDLHKRQWRGGLRTTRRCPRKGRLCKAASGCRSSAWPCNSRGRTSGQGPSPGISQASILAATGTQAPQAIVRMVDILPILRGATRRSNASCSGAQPPIASRRSQVAPLDLLVDAGNF